MTPTIRVLEFKTEYKGGKPEDWVLYSPIHAPLTAATWDKVSRMIPPDHIEGDTRGLKMQHMTAIWGMIEPAYKAWKNGQELPVNGTPLSTWPGVNAGMVEVFRRNGIKTVEDVANLTDGQMQGIHLPDVRSLKKQAMAFLEARDAQGAAARLAKQDEQIGALQEQLDAAMALLEEKKPRRSRPPKSEAA